MTKLSTSVCFECNGTGSLLRYPHYSTKMPEKRLEMCSWCNGLGEVLHLPPGLKVYIDSENTPIIPMKWGQG